MCVCLRMSVHFCLTVIMKEEVMNLRLSQGEHKGSWKRKKIG